MNRALVSATALFVFCPVLAFAQKSELLSFQSLIPYSGFSPYHDGLRRPATLAIRSENEWRKLWQEIEPHLGHDMNDPKPHPLPPINFDRYALLVFASGSKATGMFSAVIESVREDSSGIDVTVDDLEPGTNCIVTTLGTYPIAYALIDRTNKPIRFQVNRSVVDCAE